MNTSLHVYVDESGTPVLNDECYAVCAVLCNDNNLEHDLHLVDTIRASHRNGAELKSSAIAGRLERRKLICGDLQNLKSKVVVLVIRKDRLRSNGGFPYKRTAYKYCQRRLFEKIYNGFSDIHVTIDTFGNDEFMGGFKRYIDKHFQPTVFNPNKSIEFSTPLNSPMLQVSDFVGGTVRRYIQGDDDNSAFELLTPILSIVEVWPRNGRDPRVDDFDDALNLEIEKHCTLTSLQILDNESNELLKSSLEYLLFAFVEENGQFIYGDLLLNHLKGEGLIDDQKDKTWLQQRVISPLREKGVPIAASRDGYKIPRNRNDIKEFVDFVSQKTLPYLKKVNNMRTSLLIGLGNEYDMLDENPDLKNLMKSLTGIDLDQNS